MFLLCVQSEAVVLLYGRIRTDQWHTSVSSKAATGTVLEQTILPHILHYIRSHIPQLRPDVIPDHEYSFALGDFASIIPTIRPAHKANAAETHATCNYADNPH